MNSSAPSPRAPVGSTPPRDFSDLAPGPEEHFKLCWFGAVLCLLKLTQRSFGVEETRRSFPFLADYESQLAQRGVETLAPDAVERYTAIVEAWEARATVHLPLRALRRATELGWHAVLALVTAGVHEEDPRFGAVFARLQGGAAVPTAGMLGATSVTDSAGRYRSFKIGGY